MPETSIENPAETSQPRSSEATGSANGESLLAAMRSRPQSQYTTPERSVFSIRSEIVKFTISAFILAGGALTMYMLYTLKAPPEEQESKVLDTMVESIAAMPYFGQLDKVISGTVVPYREINVAAEVSGNVIEKSADFEAGNYVTAGTVLLKIDPADYQLQLDTGNAEVAQSQKMLEETEKEIEGAKLNIANSQNEYDLVKNEYDRNFRIKGALSSSELDQSKRALLAAQTALTTRQNTLDMLVARLDRMKATLELAKTQLARTKLNLTKTVVVAPDNGVIVREMVQKGDFVRAGDPLVTFEDTSRSEVICNLTPTDLAWVRNNSPASKEFANDQEKGAYAAYYLPKTKVAVYETSEPSVIWDGMLERFDGIGRDEATHTIPCRITVQSPVVDSDFGPRALVRGMFVKCRIQVQISSEDSDQRFLSFPAVALRPGNFVWVEDGLRLKKVPVEVVDYDEQLVDDSDVKIVVVSVKPDSVQVGDKIVTTPLTQPKNGMEVIYQADIESPKSATDEPATNNNS